MNRYVLASLLALPALGLCHRDADAFFSFQGYRVGTYNVSFPRIKFNFGFDTGTSVCTPAVPYTCYQGGYMCPGGVNPWAAYGPWYLHFPQGGQQGFVPANPAHAGQPHPAQPYLPNPTPIQQPSVPAAAPSATQPASYDPYAGYHAGYYQYHYNSSYNVPAYWYGR